MFLSAAKKYPREMRGAENYNRYIFKKGFSSKTSVLFSSHIVAVEIFVVALFFFFFFAVFCCDFRCTTALKWLFFEVVKCGEKIPSWKCGEENLYKRFCWGFLRRYIFKKVFSSKTNSVIFVAPGVFFAAFATVLFNFDCKTA